MARPRSIKRNSSPSSYKSTLTTIAFMALCAIGVWMLTSNTQVTPQTTNHVSKSAITTTATTTDVAADADVSISNVVEQAESRKKDTRVYEDNPGDLPDDAIKSDELKSNDDSGSKEESSDGKQEADGGDSQESSSQDLKGEESGEEQQKQEERQHQISEESSHTQNQPADQTSHESSQSEGSQEANANQEQETNANQEQEQSTVSETDDSNSHDSINQNEGQDQAQEKQKQQQEEDDFDKSSSQKQESKEDQQQGSGLDENNQESDHSEKTYEEQQQEQRQEDTGGQNSSQESQNEVSEEDQKQRIQQQQQQQQQQQTHDQESQMDSNTDQETKQESSSGESAFPGGGNPGIPKESKESWSTQAAESESQKERREEESDGNDSVYGYTWQLCNVTAGPDYIPCLDNEKALRQLHKTGHFEHRERHCPEPGPTCLVPLPQGYRKPITWPQSRDKIWYHNVPHPKLAEVKGHQNWVKVTGEFLTFPGGGTQFMHGALHYIDFVQQAVPKIKWGKHTRVILDVGCGVASFGGYMFERDVLTMSFAPKDEHEAQVQFALERGIPAISAVMGSQRLPFPSRVFDLIHCARCRVPWHAEGGKLLLELNRLLRPGGYFVWSATPVYQKLQEDVEIWQAMSALTVSMCWELVTIKKDKLNGIGAAIYRKPTTNNCYDQRIKNSPPMCDGDDDANAAWYVPLQACMHRVPRSRSQRGGKWPEDWPERLQITPHWLKSSQVGIYGKPAPQDFEADYEHWKHVVSSSYMKGLGISWSNVRNIMDMRAVYGGFAAALKDLKVWVFNVVNTDSPDTLPIIYERGLFGIYHDWCESFSTYPRTYDLLHADHLFSKLKKRCQLAPVLAEVDRIARPGGKLIVRDESSAIEEVENLLKSLHWEVHLIFSKDEEGLLSAQKGDWRPQSQAAAFS
ncbi:METHYLTRANSFERASE PMT27-RELATED [Salix koriyanagi]|uniref:METHYLTRANSFERASE PMT27-RELATED n=1 Tax=Salix koriyanagi TaxID=2511006 RepID=A0A9Q0UMX6_9ROSI|nr:METHYLTRANSFERASE PMT27-RELATED [Salix koriyanagi]